MFLLAAFSELNARQISDAILRPRFCTLSQSKGFSRKSPGILRGGRYPISRALILTFIFFCELPVMGGGWCSLASLFLIRVGVPCEVIEKNAVVQDNSEMHLGKTSTDVTLFLLLCLFPREKVNLLEAGFGLQFFCGWHWSWLLVEAFSFLLSGKLDSTMIWFLFVMALALADIYCLCLGFPLWRDLYRK